MEGVSQQAVAQSLRSRGITEGIINQSVGVDMGNTVSDEELGLVASEGQSAEAAAGMRIETSAAKATGEGLVEGHPMGQTRDQKIAELDGTKLLRTGAMAEAEAMNSRPMDQKIADMKGRFAEDRARKDREAEAERVNQDILEKRSDHVFGTYIAGEALEAWDPSRVGIHSMDKRLQSNWIFAYAERLMEHEAATAAGEDYDLSGALAKDQDEIENDHYELTKIKAPRVSGDRNKGIPRASPDSVGATGTPRIAGPGPLRADKPAGVDVPAGKVQDLKTQGTDRPAGKATLSLKRKEPTAAPAPVAPPAPGPEANLPPEVQAEIDNHLANRGWLEKLLVCLKNHK